MPVSDKPALKILVMDDEADIRELVALMLGPRSIGVMKAANWRDGMQALREHDDIDLVLLDLTLRGVPKTPVDEIVSVRAGMPVVIMSGYGAHETKEMSGQLAPVAFLQKPFRPATLYAAIERHAVTPQSPPSGEASRG